MIARFLRLQIAHHSRRRLLAATVLAAATFAGAAAAAEPPPALQTRDHPVSPEAAPEAAELLELLHYVSGKWILSGQQESPDWFDEGKAPEFPFLKEQTGREPVVRGFDFMFMSDDRNTHQRIAERMIAWHARGGIVTACFHWFAGPEGVYEGKPRQHFYTAETDFDLTRALIDGTPENAEFVREMDEVAEELKKLRDAGVPVIWRPFHECNGGWFWWGAKGPEPFKQAWRFMFDRYTRVHGLTNLLWCYNPTDAPGALTTWYPGDAYVDIVSLDIYPPRGAHPTYATASADFSALTQGRKPVGLSENGAIPDPDQLFSEGARWSWFCTWYGDFIMGGTDNPLDFVQRVYNHPRVLTLDEIDTIRPPRHAAPVILRASTDTVAAPGMSLTLAVLAAGTPPLAYSWTHDGKPIAGATGPTLRLENLDTSAAGTYRVTVSNRHGSVTAEPIPVALDETLQPPAGPLLLNLSTRGPCAGDAEQIIAGFAIDGPGAKRVLIRAAGPALDELGVPGYLPDPRLTLTTASGIVLTGNDDWTFGNDGPALQTTFATAGAFQYPGTTLDAALDITLPPGGYTAIVSGIHGAAGIAIVEVYDLEPGSPARLVNLSTRGRTGTGDEVMIAGLVLGGTGRTALLLRGIGPELTRFGVPGALADPLIELTTPDGAPLADNDDWPHFPDQAALADLTARAGAFLLPETGSADAALVHDALPGRYTLTVKGADGATGVVLSEIYSPPGPGN